MPMISSRALATSCEPSSVSGSSSARMAGGSSGRLLSTCRSRVFIAGKCTRRGLSFAAFLPGKVMAANDSRPSDFIRDMVARDVAAGKHGGKVCTRFPPEPNGYLHIGHAKSICLNFGLAQEFGGLCNLRFDDTNPETEDIEYVESIKGDVRWLGFSWDGLYFASDYFQQLYDWAVQLIRQ